VLLTTHKVWVNFHEFRTVVHQDTIPALGIGDATAENEDGDTKKVRVKKDYEIYITLK
jgi:RNA-binding protein YlmH